jgi:plasmid stabilization system protein ParE
LKRFTLNRDASSDLDGILGDLRLLPARPALRIGKELQNVFRQIAEWPQLGVGYKRLHENHGYEARSRLCGNYKIFYRADTPIPDILAILHTKRDEIMSQRLR